MTYVCREVQKGIEFISTFLFTKIPRRKVVLFGEQFSTYLMDKYRNRWDPSDPLREEEYRGILINVRGKTDQLLSVAAVNVGLELDEVINLLPMELYIYINPGEVKFKVGEFGQWKSVYAADSTDSVPMGPGGDSVDPAGIGSIFRNQMGPWSANSGTTFAPLPGYQNNNISSLNTGPSDPSAPNRAFTVESFAMTRFGTTKQKSNPQALKQIQRKAANTLACKQVPPPNPNDNNNDCGLMRMNSLSLESPSIAPSRPRATAYVSHDREMGTPLMPPGMFSRGAPMMCPIGATRPSFRPPCNNFFRPPPPPPPFWTPRF